jgi:hypothetical protein
MKTALLVLGIPAAAAIALAPLSVLSSPVAHAGDPCVAFPPAQQAWCESQITNVQQQNQQRIDSLQTPQQQVPECPPGQAPGSIGDGPVTCGNNGTAGVRG